MYEGFGLVVPGSRNEQVECRSVLTPVAFIFLPLAIMSVNSRCPFFTTCVSCYSGFIDQACEPIKIMFVIPTTIDFALGAN